MNPYSLQQGPRYKSNEGLGNLRGCKLKAVCVEHLVTHLCQSKFPSQISIAIYFAGMPSKLQEDVQEHSDS